MSTSPTAPLRRGARAILAGLALAAAVVLGTALPAAAHDELASSSPEAGAALTAAPNEVVLTFSGEVLADGAVAVVRDPSGTDRAGGAPEVLAGTVTIPLQAGLANGAYEVQWRVVSADGHPISGTIPFTLAAAAPSTAVTTPPSAAPTPTETAVAPVPTATPEPVASGGDGAGPLVWIIVAVVIVVVAIVLVVVLRRRAGGSGGAAADGRG